MDIKKILSESSAIDRTSRALFARLLNYIVASTMLIALVSLLFVYKQVFASPARLGLAGGTILVNLVAWLLLRWGKLGWAGRTLVAGYWIMAVGLLLVSGGLNSPWLMTQLSITILTGLLIGGWSGLAVAALSLVADLAIYYLQLNNIISSQPFNEGFVDNWLSLIANFTLVSLSILAATSLWQSSLRRSGENDLRYRSLFNKTNEAVFVVDPDENIMDANKQAADLLGYRVDELIGKPYVTILTPEERGAAHENFERLEREGMTPLFERTLVCKDGSRLQVEFNASAVKDEDGRLHYFQGLARDIRERKRLEEQLRFSLEEMETLAMQDALTGLLNRRAITDHAEAEWERAQREKRPMSLLLIDLDNLKKINDAKGHLVGDQVLIELAQVIKGSRRRYDWAGRWGGDEFILVLPGANLVEAEEVAERLRSS